MKQFLILVKGEGAASISQEELQRRIGRYNEWVETVGEHHLGANRLEDSGAHLVNASTVHTDGPFLEGKEMIAGYILVQANDLNHAIQLAQSCPLIEHHELFVRPMIVAQ